MCPFFDKVKHQWYTKKNRFHMCPFFDKVKSTLIRRVESSQASLTAMLPGSHPSASSVGMQSEKLHPGFHVVVPSSDRTTYLYWSSVSHLETQ